MRDAISTDDRSLNFDMLSSNFTLSSALSSSSKSLLNSSKDLSFIFCINSSNLIKEKESSENGFSSVISNILQEPLVSKTL